jgi:hypothetical protein
LPLAEGTRLNARAAQFMSQTASVPSIAAPAATIFDAWTLQDMEFSNCENETESS